MTVRTFFESDAASALDEPANHPAQIAAFLEIELRLLRRLAPGFRRVVEVACGDGRYLDVAAEIGCDYLGVDLVRRCVENGNRRVRERGLDERRYAFAQGDIEQLAPILARLRTRDPEAATLVVFPFSILTAVERLDALAAALAGSGMAFMAGVYSTSPAMTAARMEYYRRCGYSGVRAVEEAAGVRVVTADGLQTMAHRPERLRSLWRRNGVDACVAELGDVYVASISAWLEPSADLDAAG